MSRLELPQLGTDLTTALNWASKKFGGVAWSAPNFSGPMIFTSMEEPQFNKFALRSETVTIAFSADGDMAKFAIPRRGFSLEQTTSPSLFGMKLDCNTSDLRDYCGLMVFNKERESLKLSEILFLSDFARTEFRDLTEGILEGNISAFEYDETTPITVGQTVVQKFDGELYYLGQREAGDIPTFSLRRGYSNVYHAPIMAYAFEGREGRAISIVRISPLQTNRM